MRRTDRRRVPTNTPTSCAGTRRWFRGWRRNCASIRGSPCSAISTWRRRTATCTTPSAGKARSTSRRPSARPFAWSSMPAFPMRFACSSNPRSSSLGGITAWLRSSATGACASITSCFPPSSPRAASLAALTASRESASVLPITPPSLPTSTSNRGTRPLHRQTRLQALVRAPADREPCLAHHLLPVRTGRRGDVRGLQLPRPGAAGDDQARLHVLRRRHFLVRPEALWGDHEGGRATLVPLELPDMQDLRRLQVIGEYPKLSVRCRKCSNEWVLG